MSWLKDKWQALKERLNFSGVGKIAAVVVLVLAVLLSFLGMYWSSEPEQFDVVASAKEQAAERGYLNNSKKTCGRLHHRQYLTHASVDLTRQARWFYQ